jgi:hypothetical protein
VGLPRSASSLLAALALRIVRRLVSRDQWFLEIHSRQHGRRWPGIRLSTIKPPGNAFWADPFLLTHKGQRWIFFEDQPFDSPRAHIAAIELDDTGHPHGPAHDVLREPWHLSYPFVWKEGERLCMIPESSGNRSVNLYEADQPLGPWRKTATLVSDQRLADATVLRFGDLLWLFAAGASARGCIYDELHLFWAETLEGPWHPHALNPVKVDARSSRPAGGMWVDGGVLYRVAQDCATVYGGAVTLLRVDELSPCQFVESLVRQAEDHSPFEPGLPWHTLNCEDQWLVVDVLGRRPGWLTKR